MTPKEAWDIYMEGAPSPQSYIDFGFLTMITSALQRRVWYYDDPKLFCNLYVIFVGKPALGKGLVLSKVIEMLKHHKDPKRAKVITATGPEDGPLIPVGADCSTFERMLVDLTNSASRLIVSVDGKPHPYSHCSLAFMLEELSSLFRQHKSEVVKLLLRTYDCTDYDYTTKHGAPDLIRKSCVNFLAGTQMDFLQEAHDLKIFGQGFASRTIWLFETQRRFSKFHIEGASAELKAKAKSVILEHIKVLTTLYGQLTYSPEVAQYLEEWYVTQNVPKEDSAGPKMEGYYGRKKVHVLKVAAAIHFSHSYTMEITMDDVKGALALLDSVEPQMAAGLNVVGRNRLSTYSKAIYDMIKVTAKTGIRQGDIVEQFQSELTYTEVTTILFELQMLGKVIQHGSDSPVNSTYTVPI